MALDRKHPDRAIPQLEKRIENLEKNGGSGGGYIPSAHSHIIKDVTGLDEALKAKAEKSHAHDDRYYTEEEIDEKLSSINVPTKTSELENDSGYVTNEHDHDISDVTGLQNELDSKAALAHTHDDRYYTEEEIDSKLSNFSGGGSGGLDETAVKALIAAAIQADNEAKYPVGKIIMETENVNPATYLGFGTWVAWGSGRVPVGVDTSQTEFESVEKMAGEKTHVLTVNETAAHTHTVSGTAASAGGHAHTVSGTAASAGGHYHTATIKLTENALAKGTVMSRVSSTGTATSGLITTSTNGAHTHTVSGTAATNGAHAHTVSGTAASAGGGVAHNNLQPYITCYMWKRTA